MTADLEPRIASAMDVLFCHGLESGPHGRKYQALCDAGFAVHAPDCRGMSLRQRVESVLPILAAWAGPPILVGSSYGGITALCAAIVHHEAGHAVKGLLLCAPALALPEPPATELRLCAPAPTFLLHGVGDDICPIGFSRAFAAGDARARLYEVDDDHRLSRSMPQIVALTRALVEGTEPDRDLFPPP